MTDESAQIAKGVAVAVTTVSGSVYLAYAQTIVPMLGVLTASTLSIVLTVKAIVDIKYKKKMEKAQLEDIEYRQEHDLPCRRCTDKEGHEHN